MNLRIGFALLMSIAASLACACDKREAKDAAPGHDAPAVTGDTQPTPKSSSPSPKLAVVDAGPVEKVEIPEVRVRKDATTTVRVSWITPKGTAVNDEAPFRVRWNRSDGLADAPSDVKATGSTVKDGFRVKVRPMGGAPNATLGGVIDIVVCDAATHAVCVPVRRNVELGFIVAEDAADEATVSIPLPEARAN